MNKLWNESAKLNPSVEAYTVGDDYIFDTKLLSYDLKASQAHAGMLLKIGVLKKDEYKKLEKALHEIKKLHRAGKFAVKPEQEDCHTAIEQYITKNYGAVGKKIHAGRSRNDQAMAMIRLYMKDNIEEIIKLLTETAAAYAAKKKLTEKIPMPGYTHMQKAMPSKVGTWFGAYGDAFSDLIGMMEALKQLIDQNPLGSAAGFGVTGIEIDRSITTKELGFAKIQDNPMYCGLSRGFFELAGVQQLSLISTLAGKFASDMMLFTTQEFDYFSLPAEYTTGSSIMPNKQNYDIFEIMRGNGGLVAGYQNQIQNIVSGLGSGFHRDFQLTKPALVKSIEITISTLKILIEIIPKIEVNETKLNASMTDDLYATQKAYELVALGVPFRDAYNKVKANLP